MPRSGKRVLAMPRSGKRGEFSTERKMGGFPRHGRREEKFVGSQESNASMAVKKETENSKKGRAYESSNRESDTSYFDENGFENDLDP